MAARLRRIGAAVLGCLAAFTIAGAVHAQTCEAREARHAQMVSGEVYGGHDLVLDAGPGFRLALFRSQYGWRIAVLDEEARDLVPPSPARGFVPLREIDGWHFRNADNTGPNTGDINAPQRERQFSFLFPGDTDVASGAGSLVIADYGLADLGPGQQARMVYLRFDACLTWPKTEDEMRAEADLASPDFLPEEEEIMRACGLDADYALDAWVTPRMLGGDFDGDGALDSAAYVRRIIDGRRGAAICRAGTWLDVLGVDGPVPGSPMEENYFDMVEAWRVSTMDDVPGGWDGEAPRPQTAGDVLVLERVEKALYSIYWDGAAFRSHRHYRYVEP